MAGAAAPGGDHAPAARTAAYDGRRGDLGPSQGRRLDAGPRLRSRRGRRAAPGPRPGPCAPGEGCCWDDAPARTPPAWAELEQQHEQIRRGTDLTPVCEADGGLCPTLAVVGETLCPLHLGWPLCPGIDGYTCTIRTRNGDHCATRRDQARYARLDAVLPVTATDDGTCPGHTGPCGRAALPGDPLCARCLVASQRDRDRVLREWEAIRDAGRGGGQGRRGPREGPCVVLSSDPPPRAPDLQPGRRLALSGPYSRSPAPGLGLVRRARFRRRHPLTCRRAAPRGGVPPPGFPGQVRRHHRGRRRPAAAGRAWAAERAEGLMWTVIWIPNTAAPTPAMGRASAVAPVNCRIRATETQATAVQSCAQARAGLMLARWPEVRSMEVKEVRPFRLLRDGPEDKRRISVITTGKSQVSRQASTCSFPLSYVRIAAFEAVDGPGGPRPRDHRWSAAVIPAALPSCRRCPPEPAVRPPRASGTSPPGARPPCARPPGARPSSARSPSCSG